MVLQSGEFVQRTSIYVGSGKTEADWEGNDGRGSDEGDPERHDLLLPFPWWFNYLWRGSFNAAFARSLLEACKSEGISTAIETSAFAEYEVVEQLLPWLDVALCDMKHVDEEKHLRFTGLSNRGILENIRSVFIFCHITVWARQNMKGWEKTIP